MRRHTKTSCILTPVITNLPTRFKTEKNEIQNIQHAVKIMSVVLHESPDTVS